MTVKTGETSTRRKPRSITATDSEWHRITTRASQAGLSIGRYLAERALASEQVDDTAAAKAAGTVPDGYSCQTQIATTKFDFDENADGSFRLINDELHARIERQATELVKLAEIFTDNDDITKKD